MQVKYRTGPGAEALQWLMPAQTAGGKLPDTSAWGTSERVRFLDELPRRQSTARRASVVRVLPLYAQARPGHHSVTTGSVDKVVPLASVTP